MFAKRMERSDKERVYYLDILKIIAIFAVIFIHVTPAYLEKYDTNTLYWVVSTLQDSFSRFAVPIFIMVTGALFGKPEKQINLKSFYKKNVLRLFTALMFWYVFYVFAIPFVDSLAQGTKFSISDIDFNPWGHLWYLFFAIGLYMAIPLLKLVTASEKATKYFIVIAIVFSFIIPQILQSPFMQTMSLVRKLSNIMYENFYTTDFQLGFGYISYFVIGYKISIMNITRGG